uniref:Platelet-activating factor receptor n=1 Tax=Oncorhynchus kisutch TaxID=8019 RepID=A0A8C7CQY1_ONCKI
RFINRTLLDSEFRYTLFPLFYGVVFVLGLIANSYVLFVLQRMQDTKAMNEICIYMANLTVAHLFFVCALPFWIGYYHHRGDWRYGDFLCRVTGVFFFINTYCSVLFLAAISVNRYWAITRPLDATSSDHWRRGVAITAVIWALTLSMSMPLTTRSGLWPPLIIVGCLVLVFFLVVVCNLLIARALLAPVPYPASGTRPCRCCEPWWGCSWCASSPTVWSRAPGHWLYWRSRRAGAEWTGTRQWLNDAHQVTLMLMGRNCLLDPVVYCFATRKFRLYIKDNLKKVGRGKRCSETAITHISMVECKNVSQRLHSEQQQLKV